MQPWFTVYVFGIGYPYYDQLTPVKIRYPLTSITWPYRGLKLTADRGQVFFWSLPLTKRYVFSWTTGSCLVNLFKTGQDCSGRRLMLTHIYGDYWNSKQKAKQYTENLRAKLQNSNQNSTFSWINLMRLWTTRSRSYAFRLA